MKKCSKCGIEKNEDEFAKTNKSKIGSYCKECANAYYRKKYNKQKEHERYLRKKAKNPVRWNEMSRICTIKLRKKNREKYLEVARKSAKKHRARFKRTPEQLIKERIYCRKWKEENKEKTKTHYLVLKALKDGFLIKPNQCEHCRQERELHGHHEDYNKPYEVIWLCRECHGIRHRSVILKPQQIAV